MKKVKLNDLGRGVHFFLENFIEDKKVEFMILRHFPECAQQDATEGYTLVEAAGITHAAVFMKDNLAGVWGPELIQDHPKGMVWPEVV